METLKELKSQTNKGTIELKKKAYLSILSKYSDDDKVINYVTNKLVKLSSANLFSEVITSHYAQILPLMAIYMRRIIECKSAPARRDALKFGAFRCNKGTYESTIPWRKGDKDIIKTVILNDQDMYVREDAFAVFVENFGNSYPTQVMYELIDRCIEKPYLEGGVSLRKVYHYIPFLPYTVTMYEYIFNKVTQVPVDQETDHLVKQFQYHHPNEFLPLIPIIKRVIDEYIISKSPSLISKLFGKKTREQNEDNIMMLANALLNACDEDKEIVTYMQYVAEKMDDDDLYEYTIVKFAYGSGYRIDFVESEIYKVIGNTQKRFKLRLFAIEKLKDFYNYRKISPPSNSLEKILEFFDNVTEKKKKKIISTFKPEKDAKPTILVTERVTDKNAKTFFNIITDPLNKSEKKKLWEIFLNLFHSNHNNINTFIEDLIEAQAELPFERNIIFHIDHKAKEEVEIRINNSIKLLKIPPNIETYKKSSDYSLQIIDQLKLYALALKKYNYNIVGINMGWDDYVAIIIKDKDKTTFNDFLSKNNFYESINYL